MCVLAVCGQLQPRAVHLFGPIRRICVSLYMGLCDRFTVTVSWVCNGEKKSKRKIKENKFCPLSKCETAVGNLHLLMSISPFQSSL